LEVVTSRVVVEFTAVLELFVVAIVSAALHVVQVKLFNFLDNGTGMKDMDRGSGNAPLPGTETV
jgi:hypothetical protein